jgi:glycosyltransferase involved in cell wall biosynthesis
MTDLRSDPLSIALVHTSDSGGGAEISTYSLFRSLKELGHNCRLFVARKSTQDPDVHEIARYRPFPGLLRAIQFLEEHTGWQYFYQPWFRRLDKLLGPEVDVVHYHSLWYGRAGFAEITALPRLTRLYPSLITLRDWWMVTGHCAHPAEGCERWKTGCGQCPDLSLSPAVSRDGTRFNWTRKRVAIGRSKLRVTAVSSWMAKLAEQSPIFEGKPVHTVHNGIDHTVFFPRDRASMRQKHRLPMSDFIVMIAGQSVEGTNRTGAGAPLLALDALVKSETNPFLLAVGASASNVLRQWNGRGQAVEFQTQPEIMAEYYCAADVVVVASLWETFGRVPAEAQMCGVPVAAFGTGGIPEVVKHESTGLICKTLDTDALGEAIRGLAGDSELRGRYGSAAATRALELFSHLAIARKFVEHYRAEIELRSQESSRSQGGQL